MQGVWFGHILQQECHGCALGSALRLGLGTPALLRDKFSFSFAFFISSFAFSFFVFLFLVYHVLGICIWFILFFFLVFFIVYVFVFLFSLIFFLFSLSCSSWFFLFFLGLHLYLFSSLFFCSPRSCFTCSSISSPCLHQASLSLSLIFPCNLIFWSL